MARVLVTGGAGFLGSHLVQALLTAGDEVAVLDNLHRAAPGHDSAGVEFHRADLRDRAPLQRAAQGREVIYHLAAQSNVMGAVSNLEYSFTTNVVGTYNVLTVAREAGVRRVVFSSSREVYGEVDTLPVHESRPLAPKNAYGASKAAAEIYCRTFEQTYGMPVAVLRLANVYGPGDRDRVIPNWLENARRGQDLELYGGDQILDFVPVGLVVEALRRAATTQLRGLAVNIGSGSGTSLRCLAERIQRLPGVRSGLSVLPARAVEVTRFQADIERMRELLHIEPPADPLVELESLWESRQDQAQSCPH